MGYRKNLVLLNRGTQPERNLFLVHDGTGRIEGYYKLAACINHDFSVYAVNLAETVGFIPAFVSVEELAACYVKQIKQIQPQGEYFIGGWSTGGLIGFEIVNQLEQGNAKISLCALMDAPPPGYFLVDAGEFSLESELDFIRQRVPEPQLIGKLSSATSVNELWDCMLNNLGSLRLDKELVLNCGEQDFSGLIPHAACLQPEELFYAVNVIRTLQYARARYIPSRKLDSTVHQFIAVHSPLAKGTWWDKYCTETRIYQVAGDHYSMLKEENIVSFAERFNAVLENLA